jgi:pilus assembly protein CpaC
VSSTAKLDRALDLASRYAPDRVSNLMVVGGTQQVMLKVRFAEMSRSVGKALGGSLEVSGNGTDADFAAGGGGGVEGAFGGVGVSFGIGDFAFDVALEALETKGLVRTLAEPNLVALSGQEARFLAGGEYPLPVAQSNDGGDSTITVEFKPFGVELNFTPVVVDGDIINLTLNAAVSAIDPTITFTNGDITLEGFSRRETSTTVEMRDGQSFAIAGLLQDDFIDSASQVPWIGDVPILGALFRSADFRREQSELVVIVTPHLVTPVSGEALALPTDRVRIPTERDLFLFGSVAGAETSGAAGEVARQDFSTSYGYVME